ncbi:MAG TPA: hypothetical protein DDW68_03035 [Verrucomicrobiales bacterium]|nr:hypothetical protein [Verrucomicrobiales bacterium]HBE96133.1 hypothetical protein [Verrucomicrobiales bacterium]
MGYAFRLAKTVLALALGTGFFAIAGGLIYLNQVGFPGQYGDWVRSELSGRGLHLDFTSLRFDLRRGLVATDVQFYANKRDSIPILEAQEITLDLDKTKALRGEFKLINLIIIDGSTLVPTKKENEKLEASGINGRVTMTDSGRIRFHDASGLIEGIQVSFTADFKAPVQKKRTPEDGPKKEPRTANKILHLIFEEMDRWELPNDLPPELEIVVRGDLSHPDRINTEFSFSARNLKRNDYALKKLKIEGDLRAQLVTLDTIYLEDETGYASGEADWSITRRKGRFNLDSSLQFKDFINSCFIEDEKKEILPRLNMARSPVISVSGSFTALPDENFSIKASGSAHLGDFKFLNTRYEELSSQFSWHDGDLYLRDLMVKHADGQLDGNILSRGRLVNYKLTSTLPLSAFDPFITPGSKTKKELERVKFGKNSLLDLDIQGEINRDDLTTWTSTGKAHMNNLIYRDTALHRLAMDFEIGPKKQEFKNVKCLINDEKEVARTRVRGKASSELTIGSVLVDHERKQTVISNLQGKFWPSPIVRIFAPKTSAHLEKTYRFHQPPSLKLNGSFDNRFRSDEKNIYLIEIQTEGQTDYPFLGKPLPVTKLKTNVTVRRSLVTVDKLSFSTVGGTAAGKVVIDATRQAPPKYTGDIRWNRLYFPEISKVYKFKEKEKGWLTGQIAFSGVESDLRQFNATGVIGIEKGNLVALPIFGPLSPLIAGVLGDKRMGYERAKDASATFAIKNGVWMTEDFSAVSTSLNLTGEGWIDLNTDRIEMIVRINARGLLGLLTTPLTLLKGMFQFRGTGDFTNPKWKPSPFTRPAKGLADPIFRKPGRAQIIQE